MVVKCTFKQLEEFLNDEYEEEFSWDFDGSIVMDLELCGVALPIDTVEELIVRLKMYMDELYLIVNDDEDKISEISNSSDIGEYIIMIILTF